MLTKRFKTPPKTRLFMILDEFSKLRLDHKQVEDFISTSREAGAVSVIFLQDVSQIREEIRAAVLANCQDKYFLHGAGPQTAEWCSKALGDRRRLNTSMSESESANAKTSSTGLSTSVTESWVPVLRPREIATTGGLKYGAWIVLSRYSHKPILVNLERSAP
jgi:type IV secretory pathway TraG/TraD family ATPase VirD4